MNFIAYDLGTGGIKASLYNENIETLCKVFTEYPTYYPKAGYHEQRPGDWWNGVVESTKTLLKKANVAPEDIACVSLSGHSLVALPMAADGSLLLEQVPIWSDTRPDKEVDTFFSKVDETEWYLTTGNGFPAPCYSIFKLMWMKKHQPEIFAKTHKFLGSKDYINYMLTGAMCTDYSYASGVGCYDLERRCFHPDYVAAAGLPMEIFPEIVQSHKVVGYLTESAAKATGLTTKTAVVCGGVDNSCMALGAVGAEEGRIWTSLGSSSWIPINSVKPVLDVEKRPYVFAHIDETIYNSAFSIFAGGSSFQWVRNQLCKDLENDYNAMGQLAEQVPIGANGIIFNPSLAGGTSQDKSRHIRGGYVGIHLGTTREDMIRAAMEGIAMNLKQSLNYLKEKTQISDYILFCGGGSKSEFWMQMFADIFAMDIRKTNIDQDAASIGAVAIAARGMGLWEDYSKISSLHQLEYKKNPNPAAVASYETLFEVFEHVNSTMADLGDFMHAHQINQ